jgi:hypothetical protein
VRFNIVTKEITESKKKLPDIDLFAKQHFSAKKYSPNEYTI